MTIIKYFKFKISNQYNKIIFYLYKIKLKSFKSKLKKCGDNVFIQFPVCFEGIDHISIGNNVYINAFTHMWGHGEIEIGNDTLIASHTAIVSITHDSNAEIYKDSIIKKKVTIGNNVWIGTHATILQGVSIGDNAVIGAGSVVNKNVDPNTIVVGVPAKIIRKK